MNNICVNEDCTDLIIFVPTVNIDYICGSTAPPREPHSAGPSPYRGRWPVRFVTPKLMLLSSSQFLH